MYEANYTTFICSSLRNLNYRPLYSVIDDMVNPLLTDVQRIACMETVDNLRLEFQAAAKAVEVVGSNEAKVTINRFMGARKAALDNFTSTVPPPTAAGPIIAALGDVGNTLIDLRAAIFRLTDELTRAITISNIFGADRDDRARDLIGELASQGSLPQLAFTIKLDMVNWLLSSSGPGTIDVTTDDEEDAVNSVMRAAKEHDKAELYQLAQAVTWESLDSNIHGDQYKDLLDILNGPD